MNLEDGVMISIRPEWCRMILRGEKTLEIRKTKPKLKPPFKCYIYCTLAGSKEFFANDLGGSVALWNSEKWWEKKGNVVGEFTCNRFYNYSVVFPKANNIPDYAMHIRSRLTNEQIAKYEKAKVVGTTLKCGVYAWEISNLVVYDKPKKLSEFGIEHAPQSWCYCEKLPA